jgi:hypothetical protein
LFAESANDESVSGAFALLGTTPFVNTPDPVGPSLEIVLLDRKQVKVQWPAPSFGFHLQSSISLTPPAWTNVFAEVDVTERYNCVTLSVEPRHTFFRLFNPLEPGATCNPWPGQECLE